MKKKSPKISASRIALEKSVRTNPLRSFEPQRLAMELENFERGYLSGAAQLFHQIKKRDDIVCATVEKRKKSVARLSWSIVAQGADEAVSREHTRILENFYNSVEVSSVLVPDKRGGMAMLFELALTALESQYGVFEIIWKPSVSGIRARFNFVPLWFFESTTGFLRFKQSSLDTYGEEMLPGEWLIAANDVALMEPTSHAYLLKRLALGDWSLFSERFGSATPAYTTKALRGTSEWEQAEEIVANLVNGAGFVMSEGEKFELLQASAQGLPMPGLVDRLDRAITAIWCGSDLATLSSKDGAGASLQAESQELLEDSDCRLIEESLEHYVSRFVLRYHYGREVEPAAYLQIARTNRSDKLRDLEIVERAAKLGCRIAKSDVYELCALPIPASGAELVDVPQDGAALAPDDSLPLANEGEPADLADIARLAEARGKDIKEVYDRLLKVYETSSDPETYGAALDLLLEDFPRYFKGGEHEAEILAEIMEKAAGLDGGQKAAAANEDADNAKMPENAPEGPEADVLSQNGRNGFCNGILQDCNGIAQADGDRDIAKQSRKGRAAPSMDGTSRSFPEEKVALANGVDGWYLIAPYGDYPKTVKNEDGKVRTYIQRITPETADRIIAKFSSLWMRVKTKFSNTCPVYYGHPDAEQFAEKYPDKTPYGKTLKLKKTPEGIAAQIKWLEGFEELPEGLSFSPYFEFSKPDPEDERPVVEPDAILSLGIVRFPNISKTSLANEGGAQTSTENENMDKNIIAKILKAANVAEAEIEKFLSKLPDAPTAEDIEAATGSPSDSAEAPAPEAPENRLEVELENERSKCAAANEALAAERAARAKLFVEKCVAEGKIAPAEAEAKTLSLANSSDFDALADEYASRPPMCKTQAKTGGLNPKSQMRLANETDFVAKVGEFQKSGMTYSDAWNAAKTKHADIYKAAFEK